MIWRKFWRFCIVLASISGLVLIVARLITRRAEAGDGPARQSVSGMRRLNRRLFNPVMLAVTRFLHVSYPSVVNHTGRRSGRAYTTPVLAARTADGFVISLPYGTNVEWRQNVQAADHFRLDYGGVRFSVTNPALIGAGTGRRPFPAWLRFLLWLAGTEHFLHVQVRRAPG